MRFITKSKITSSIILVVVTVVVIIVISIFYFYHHKSDTDKNAIPKQDDSFTITATSSQPEVVSLDSIATSTKYDLKESLIMPLGNGNNLYFLIGQPAGDWCGSGGCTYDTYIGSSFKTIKRVTGFDSHWLDCDTNKVSLEKDTIGDIFGSLTLDKENSIVKNWYHLSSSQGTEEIYHIAKDGTPTVIASYDLTCSSTPRTLFRSSSYPQSTTAF